MEHAVLARLQTERAQGGAMVRSRRAFWIVVVALRCDHGQQRPQPDLSHLPNAIRLVYGGELTLVFATVVIGVIPSLLYLGLLSDRAGRRPLLVVALAHAVAGALAFTLASGLGGVLVARALQGVAFGALSGTAVAALVELEPAGDHARATLVATATIVSSKRSGRSARDCSRSTRPIRHALRSSPCRGFCSHR